jgi:hypothetical protein
VVQDVGLSYIVSDGTVTDRRKRPLTIKSVCACDESVLGLLCLNW